MARVGRRGGLAEHRTAAAARLRPPVAFRFPLPVPALGLGGRVPVPNGVLPLHGRRG
ncbi:MAG: hypothetical protein RL153_464 [Verrucomicrobiota bacterium]